MGLVSFLPPIELAIPHEPGESMTFQKPPQSVVRDARKAVEADGRRGFRDFGPEVIQGFFASKDDDEKVVRRTRHLEAASEYDANNFDRDILLNHSLIGWSFRTANGEPIPVTKENIANLEERDAAWAHQTIVDMLKPPTAEDSKSTAA